MLDDADRRDGFDSLGGTRLQLGLGLAGSAALLIRRNGAGGLAEVVDEFRGWSLLPGLLGSFSFAGLSANWRRVRAASPLLFGLPSQCRRIACLRSGLLSRARRSSSIVGQRR